MAPPTERVRNLTRPSGPEAGWLATIAAAVLAAALGLAALPPLVRVALPPGTGARTLAGSLAVVVLLLLLAVVVMAALTVVGGTIALRRHALERRGRPYAPRRRRERRVGFLVRAVYGGLRSVAAMRAGTLATCAFFPFDEVEVRSLEEIRQTLDSRGGMDGLPFMPEMAACCGRRLRVFRRAEKIHDYVSRTGLRRLRNTVMLEGIRCDGQYHGGCQARCHTLWKEAWLKPAATISPRDSPQGSEASPVGGSGRLNQADRVEGLVTTIASQEGVRYVCQMTEVARASSPMSWNDPRHYLRELCVGNVRPLPFITGVSIDLFNRVQRRLGNGVAYPVIATTSMSTSPHRASNLRPGDRIRVRPKHEIEATLTTEFKNRGLWFDREMLRFCGGEYIVSATVRCLIEEKTGRLLSLRNPCVILDGVTATGEHLAFCPQDESILWREIWLDRVSGSVNE